jgi:3-oxoacyl-(acyl-carrier-protein) synthase
MDSAVQVAVAAGLEALKDAGIVNGEGKSGWVLPAHMQATTGVVYATSFPALDTAISEVTKYFQSKSLQNTELSFIMAALRQKLHSQIGNQPLSSETETALNALQDEINKIAPNEDNNSSSVYEYDRKFLFRILVLGNAQLAQIIKARGPNMQTNAACAGIYMCTICYSSITVILIVGSTQAIALAHDMIQLGRAERMIVVAGDNASSDTLMPWLGNGFRALGAATIKSEVKDAALPFDVRRSGMILGSGGIGMVLESEDGAMRRFNQNTPDSDDYSLGEAATTISVGRPYRCRLLGSLYTNSAYHGAALDHQHIAEEMERFIASVELELNITRSHIARNGVYFSHETSTNASPTASCACNEVKL